MRNISRSTEVATMGWHHFQMEFCIELLPIYFFLRPLYTHATASHWSWARTRERLFAIAKAVAQLIHVVAITTVSRDTIHIETPKLNSRSATKCPCLPAKTVELIALDQELALKCNSTVSRMPRSTCTTWFQRQKAYRSILWKSKGSP